MDGLRAEAVFAEAVDSFVCTSGDWGDYQSSVPVRGPAPPSWLHAYRPLMADVRIAMDGQRGRLLGATSVNVQQGELRAAFVR